jgi:hypothetical protein
VVALPVPEEGRRGGGAGWLVLALGVVLGLTAATLLTLLGLWLAWG